MALKLTGDDERRLNINDLRPNMVLSRTVLTNDGLLLIPKDVPLDRMAYMRLRHHEIYSAYVRISSINAENPTFREDSFGDEEQNLEEFRKLYSGPAPDLSTRLKSIGYGSDADASAFIEIAESLTKKIPYKTDVFLYLDQIRNRGDHIYSHSADVAMLSNLFGLWLGYSDAKVSVLTMAGALHDIGKTQIPDAVLNKSGKLTLEDSEIIQRHPVYGYYLTDKLGLDEEVKLAALLHHERADGSGYPLGISLEHLTEITKIVMICDVYCAMTAKRVYRAKICPFDVIGDFEKASNLDPKLLALFLQNIACTYIGSKVLLTDGTPAEVVFINNAALSRPMVRSDGGIIDLSLQKGLKIAEVL